MDKRNFITDLILSALALILGILAAVGINAWIDAMAAGGIAVRIGF